ncbi:MAG: glycosyltransferase [Planctomycetota bacterium]
MSITHVIGSLDPATGGPPRVALALAGAQALAGRDVAVWTPEGPTTREGVRDAYPGSPGLDAVAFGKVDPGPSALDALRGAPPPDAWASAIQHADVLHLHGVWEPVLLAAAAHARKVNTPYVVTPHGMLDPWSLSQGRLKKKFALALGFKRMIDRAAWVHALNADEAELLKPLGLRAPGKVIGNGVWLDQVDTPVDEGAFQKACPELRGRPYLLFLSRIHFKKGLDYLADAFAQVAGEFPQHALVVAGPDDGVADDFRHRIDKAGLTERTLLPGPVYGDAKWAALRGADAFVLPSRQEGFSIAILEALGCATPVVISQACHFPEVAQVDAGAVVDLSAQATAEGLRRVLADPKASQSMGANGRKLVEDRFTWPAIARQMLDAYAA